MTPHGRVARIVNLWEANAFELIVSEEILAEYARVIRYPRLRLIHRLTDAQFAEIDEALRESSEPSAPDETPAVIQEDPDDDHFLAASVAGAVNCLVTGDLHLLKLGSYQGIPKPTPAEFLSRFFPDSCREYFADGYSYVDDVSSLGSIPFSACSGGQRGASHV